MTTRVLCDECQQPVPEYDHLHLGSTTSIDWHGRVVPEEGLDFCGYVCIAAWSQRVVTNQVALEDRGD